ncbi:hypothetical protein TorRG33x02_187200 [Trema orientale]|uniref:Endonuclease/exonuclease/phosphatase n=1 Tax=Trema orientale TaxID=63057 RepID=A0A2P5EIR3_TREOI|nr:hypothetical protein TorRG33x02_187200 [Trema orientale]
MEVRVVFDHCPLVLDTTTTRWGPSPIHFEIMWLEHKSFNKEFERWWNESNTSGWKGYKFPNKLKIIKEKLKRWNVDVFRDVRMIKESLCRRARELDALKGSGRWNDQLIQERLVVKCELEEIIFKEEIALCMKSKFSWAKEGDTNIKLFHRLMNARNSKNFITRIELEDRSYIKREKEIVKVVTEL